MYLMLQQKVLDLALCLGHLPVKDLDIAVHHIMSLGLTVCKPGNEQDNKGCQEGSGQKKRQLEK